MEQPEGVYRSLTKHLWSNDEMSATVCQFPSHCACVKHSETAEEQAAPSRMHHSYCCLPCRSPSVVRDLTGPSSSPPLPPLSSVLLFLLTSSQSPISNFPSFAVFPPILPAPILLFFFNLQCRLIRGLRKGQYKDIVWPTHWPHSTLFSAIISSH